MSLADPDFKSPDTLTVINDESQPYSRLFSQEVHGNEVVDDCIASLRRLSSDDTSVVLSISGFAIHNANGVDRSGFGVFFSPASRFNLAERVPMAH